MTPNLNFLLNLKQHLEKKFQLFLKLITKYNEINERSLQKLSSLTNPEYRALQPLKSQNFYNKKSQMLILKIICRNEDLTKLWNIQLQGKCIQATKKGDKLQEVVKSSRGNKGFSSEEYLRTRNREHGGLKDDNSEAF